MLRVVERVLGEGEVTRDGHALGRVAYELALYQHWTSTPEGLVGQGYDIEGHFIAAPDRLESWLGTRAPLVVRLDDGRYADLYLVNLDGVVTPADERGFYTV